MSWKVTHEKLHKNKANMKTRARERKKLFLNFISIRCRKVKSEDYDKNHLNQIMSFLLTSRTAVCTSFKIVIITYTRRCFYPRCASLLLCFWGLVEFSATAKKATWECYVVIKEWENMSRLIRLTCIHQEGKEREKFCNCTWSRINQRTRRRMTKISSKKSDFYGERIHRKFVVCPNA